MSSQKSSLEPSTVTAGMNRSYKTKNFSAFEYLIFLWDRSREMKFDKEEKVFKNQKNVRLSSKVIC